MLRNFVQRLVAFVKHKIYLYVYQSTLPEDGISTYKVYTELFSLYCTPWLKPHFKVSGACFANWKIASPSYNLWDFVRGTSLHLSKEKLGLGEKPFGPNMMENTVFSLFLFLFFN